MTTTVSGKWNCPCIMGAECNHRHPHDCEQATLENTDAYKNEMARRAALSGIFSVRQNMGPK
jgi:hypothetical protein